MDDKNIPSPFEKPKKVDNQRERKIDVRESETPRREIRPQAGPDPDDVPPSPPKGKK